MSMKSTKWMRHPLFKWWNWFFRFNAMGLAAVVSGGPMPNIVLKVDLFVLNGAASLNFRCLIKAKKSFLMNLRKFSCGA